MCPTLDELSDLLLDCLVRVDGASPGSGFFVAPGFVVTCAHVAGAAGERVRIRWQDTSVEGLVRWASPPARWPQPAPYLDLAVVKLATMPQCHPSVWLDDHLPSTDARFLVAGHAQLLGPEVDRTSGRFTNGGWYGEMIRLSGEEVSPGMSGGPVLNAETGGVCAITKATRQADHPSGGFAIPVRGIRMVMGHSSYRKMLRHHESHHRRNRRWIDLADGLSPPPAGIDRQSERKLRAILVDLPDTGDPGEYLGMYQRVSRSQAKTPGHPLCGYGDVVTELATLMPAERGLPHALVFVADLVRAARYVPPGSKLEDRLRQWVWMTAGHLNLSVEQVDILLPTRETALPAGETAGRTGREAAGVATRRAARAPRTAASSVMVCVKPAGHDGTRFRRLIWRYHHDEDVEPVVEGHRSEPLEALRRRLRRELPGIVRETAGGQQRVMIELIVPQGLVDEEVDQWSTNPAIDDEQAGLGQAYPVVVRDLDRFEGYDAGYPAWRERWEALDCRDIGATLDLVRCVDRRGHAAMRAHFETDPGRAALVLPCSPKDQPARVALEAGLDAGVPVMIWRRDGCVGAPDISHDDCPGRRLAVAVQASLAGAHRDGVPEQVRLLRNQSVEHPERCGRQIVLLWDDPGRRPPRRPMSSPNEPDERRRAGG